MPAMSLDILTPRGQKTLADERAMADAFMARYPGMLYMRTGDDQPAAIDAMVARNARMYAVAETKCRYNVTAEDFLQKFGGTWLVTESKLNIARRIAMDLCLPLVGFLYLVDSRVLLFQSITNAKGELQVDIQTKWTETQETCNGGKIWRNNCYIDMRKANRLHVPREDALLMVKEPA